MKLSLKQAAEQAERTKSTILNAIKKGKVSAEKDEHGQWRIDPAELQRVYPPKTRKPDNELHQSNDAIQVKTQLENEYLKREINALREALQEEKHTKEKLLGIVEQNNRLLLQYQQVEDKPKKRGIFSFGKK